MAGKIIADTLEHSTAGSLDTQYVVNGSAKVWFYLTQSGTQTLQDSFNCSSVTDDATGQSTVSFASSMNNAVWASTSDCGNSANDISHTKYFTARFGTGSCDYVVYDIAAGWVDGWGSVSIQGDLA